MMMMMMMTCLVLGVSFVQTSNGFVQLVGVKPVVRVFLAVVFRTYLVDALHLKMPTPMKMIYNITLFAHRQIGKVQRISEFRSIVPFEGKAENTSQHVYRQH